MQITKLSTKGQIVIPEQIREGIKEGTAFVVTKIKEMIVLKEIESLTKEEIEELKEIEEAWKEIDEGKCITMKAEEFLEEMKKW